MNRQERDHAIVELAKTGLTYDEIGRRFGITRERVRQLLKPHGIDGTTMRATRAAQKQADLAADRERLLDWTQHHPGQSPRDAETALGLRSGRAGQALGADVRRLFVVTPHPFPVRYTDEAILASLRAASTVQGDPLSTDAYDEYVQAFGGPSGALVHKRFPSWKAACRAAGLTVHDQVGNTHRRWSQGQLVEVLIDYFSDPSARGSFCQSPHSPATVSEVFCTTRSLDVSIRRHRAGTLRVGGGSAVRQPWPS